MNCRRFQDNLFDYVDGALSRRAQAAAERHLEQCDGCLQALDDLQKSAQCLSNHFRQDTGSLTLSARARRRIMAAAEGEMAAPAAFALLLNVLRPLAWLGAGVAVLLVAAALAFGPWTRHKGAAQSFAAISLQISYCDPTYTFSTDGNFVIDSLTCEPRIVEELLQLPGRQTRRDHDGRSPL